MRAAEVPSGFVRFTVHRATAVCAQHVADSFRVALQSGTLFEYAQSHPGARTLIGRGAVYAVQLPNTRESVVVRHNHHGGWLAAITGDLFRAPTRAPLELRISETLRAHSVPTPPMLGYVTYDAWLGFQRSDVVTREIPNSADLSHAFMSGNALRRAAAVVAAADLVRTLSAAGARHADLNVKNILLHGHADGTVEAMVLDVDRVTFEAPNIALERNLARLLRSARKWQSTHGAAVTDAELSELAALVRDRGSVPARLSTSS